MYIENNLYYFSSYAFVNSRVSFELPNLEQLIHILHKFECRSVLFINVNIINPCSLLRKMKILSKVFLTASRLYINITPRLKIIEKTHLKGVRQ